MGSASIPSTICKESSNPSPAALALDDSPELAYASESDPARRRRFAQFFTPFPLAAFMARWILDGGRSATVADPALGLGVFARALAAAGDRAHRVTGFEIDPLLADRAGILLASLPPRIEARVERRDFLESSWDARFDAVLCNPPWLRCRDWGGRAARLRDVEARTGVRLGGLANLHSLFLLKALHQVAEGGRAAFVLPWEFLDADYGEPVKEYLLASGALRHAVVFDSRRPVFDGAVTTACMLLLEKGRRNRGGPEFHRASAGDDLAALYRARISAPRISRPERAAADAAPAAGLVAGAKWRKHWRALPADGPAGMVPLGSFATVLRGIATGSNAFFVLDRAAAADAGLPAEALLPCIAKARDVASPILTPEGFAALASKGRPAFLLDAAGREGHPAVAAYLERGRALGVHERFLTRHRSLWYGLEKRPPAPLWVSVFNRGGLKPVLNRAGVRNLTAFHCVYAKPGCGDSLDLLFAWLLTEEAGRLVRGNGRECGGGLEKVEPRDLAGAPVPDFARLPGEAREALRARVAEAEAAGRGPDPRSLAEAFAAAFRAAG